MWIIVNPSWRHGAHMINMQRVTGGLTNLSGGALGFKG